MMTDYAFGVEKVAHTLDGDKTGWHAVRRTDMTGKMALLGMAKDSYSVVNNDELVQTAREAFTNLKAKLFYGALFVIRRQYCTYVWLSLQILFGDALYVFYGHGQDSSTHFALPVSTAMMQEVGN